MDKTIIAVLASHDDPTVNGSLIQLFDAAWKNKQWKHSLERFQFLFTGGTYVRVVERSPNSLPYQYDPVKPATCEWLKNECGVTVLPPNNAGGVTFLGNFVANRQVSLIWPFLSSHTMHWVNPDNLALMRLCDHWRVKRLMNVGSVVEWLETQTDSDAIRNLQPPVPTLELRGGKVQPGGASLTQIEWEQRLRQLESTARQRLSEIPDAKWEGSTIALISHDEMKPRMIEFVQDYEKELSTFETVLATGTTGKEVEDAAPRLRREGKVFRYNSGPKGGDIQIATEIALGRCHVVVFFVDTMHAHPHIDDIRVVFGACMAQPSVRMATNEAHAREWMDKVVRGRP